MSIFFSKVLVSFIFKIKKPPATGIGAVYFPIFVKLIFSLIVLFNEFSFIQFNLPPIFAV